MCFFKEFFPFHGMERVFRKDHFVPRRTRYLGSCCFAVGPASAALARQGNGICPRSLVIAGLPRLSGSLILGCFGSMARCRCSFGNAGHFCTSAGPSSRLSCIGQILTGWVFELFKLLEVLISSPIFITAYC